MESASAHSQVGNERTDLGGNGDEQGLGIVVDASSQAHVMGTTRSTNFPTANPYQATLAGGADAFVTKLNAAGTGLLYSTYLGGSDTEEGLGIAVDATGNAYVTGGTHSPNFPGTAGSSIQGTYGDGQDAFVTKLNAAGTSLVYSTYLGGNSSDRGESIAVDGTGQAYVTGLTASTNFPAANSVQATVGGQFDAFVTKLNAAGTSLLFSTYLGGDILDHGQGIAVDATHQAYVTGVTRSTNYPTASPAQATFGGESDAFVTKITFETPFNDFNPHVKLTLGPWGTMMSLRSRPI